MSPPGIRLLCSDDTAASVVIDEPFTQVADPHGPDFQIFATFPLVSPYVDQEGCIDWAALLIAVYATHPRSATHRPTATPPYCTRRHVTARLQFWPRTPNR